MGWQDIATAPRDGTFAWVRATHVHPDRAFLVRFAAPKNWPRGPKTWVTAKGSAISHVPDQWAPHAEPAARRKKETSR